jgi:hypothetical protein
MGFPEEEGLEEPPRIQRRLVFPTGLQIFPGASFHAPSMGDLGTEEPEWVATFRGKRQRLCLEGEVTPPTAAAASPLVLKGHPANAAALVAAWEMSTPIMGSPFKY